MRIPCPRRTSTTCSRCAKQRAAPWAARAAVAAATRLTGPSRRALLLLRAARRAARARRGAARRTAPTSCIHRYEGGGVTVDGPSVLVRKGIGESFSVSATITSTPSRAPRSTSSRRRAPTRKNASRRASRPDYLRGRSTYSVGAVTSSENDYEADTYFVGLSQDMFGDLTTVSLGFSRWLGQRGQRARAGFQGARGPPQLPRGRVADPHAQHDPRAQRGDHHGRGLPAQPLPLHALPHGGPHRVHHRPRALSEHAHEQRVLGATQVLPALARRHRRAVPILQRHVG